MTLAQLAMTIRLESRRSLSDTPQSRWNRANAERMNAYRNARRKHRTAKGLSRD